MADGRCVVSYRVSWLVMCPGSIGRSAEHLAGPAESVTLCGVVVPEDADWRKIGRRKCPQCVGRAKSLLVAQGERPWATFFAGEWPAVGGVR